MKGDYLGHLPCGDPLYGYLKHRIFPAFWSPAISDSENRMCGCSKPFWTSWSSPRMKQYLSATTCSGIYGAHEAGMKTVFFKSNQGDWKAHGAEPDYIIYSFNELPRAIEFFQGR